MQQLIINGSATRLKRVTEFLEQMELEELNPTNGATAHTALNGHGTAIAGPALGEGVAAGATAEADKTTRTRRTREQIAADNAKTNVPTTPVTQAAIAAANTPAPSEERKDGINMVEMQAFTKEKAQTHGPAIRAKLAEFGAGRAGELKPEFWNAYWVFLQGL